MAPHFYFSINIITMASSNNPLVQSIIDKFHTSVPAARRHSDESRKWFRETLRKNYSNVRTARLMKEANFVSMPQIGGLYHFAYDPLLKESLPIYDKFPLCLPFSTGISKAGNKYFTGINLHYLQPKIRAALFVDLLTIKSSGYNETTKFKLSYEKLLAVSNSKWIEHAVHRYRFDHMQSKFIKIEPQVWEILLFLPTERWGKGSNSSAWKI